MTRRFKCFRNLMVSLCSALLLFLPALALAQITNVTDSTSTPVPGGHDYMGLMSDTVNPANGSLSIRIQAPVPKGRGLTMPFAFAYDSNGASHPESFVPGQITWMTNAGYYAKGGWSETLPSMTSQGMQKSVKIGNYTYYCYYNTDYVFEDPGGGRHALYLANVAQPSSTACTNLLLSDDTRGGDYAYMGYLPGSASDFYHQNYVAARDGTIFEFSDWVGTTGFHNYLPSLIEDRNGNIVSLTGNGSTFSYTDTLGRTAVSSNGWGSTGNTVSVSGLSGNYTLTWSTTTVSGYSVGSTLVKTDGYCPSAMPNGGSSGPVITAIQLPNGQSYQFGYDSVTGLVNSITYPSGAVVTYTWAVNSQSESGYFSDTFGNASACEFEYGMPAITDRYVTVNGTQVQHQHFTYSTSWNAGSWTSKSTTAVTHDLLRSGQPSYETDYTYTPYNVYPQPYDGGIFASEIPLESTITEVGLRTRNETWGDPYTMTCQQTQLSGGSWSTTKFTYGWGGLTEKDEYDFSSSSTCASPGSLLRKTAYSYPTWGNTPIYNSTFFPSGAPIQDLPSNVVVSDGTGQTWAETDYGYDGTSLTSSGVSTGHDSNYGTSMDVRGNVTSKTEVLEPGGQPGGTSSEWSYNYYDTGELDQLTDANGNLTTYTYGDDGAYVTQITYPTTGSYTHTFKYTYNLADGTLASSMDFENNQTTNYYYGQNGELLDRLTSISYPDRGLTTYAYTSICGTPSSTTIKLSGTSNYTETDTPDGLCRITSKAITSDPQGTDNTVTAYDGMGRVWTVSNPYRSTSESSYGVTTYTYDGLGRTTSVAHPDGSTDSTSFSDDSFTITDPAGKARTLTNDGLGRVASVREAPSGLNYSTSYSYDPLDDLTGVTQGSQSRSFHFDSLKRLITATNPESGTTSYWYDGNSNVSQREDGRGRYTTYSYDALNRLTSKSYSDGTPTAEYFYDWPSLWGQNTVNANGRLVLAEVLPSPQDILSAFFFINYDPVGRVTDFEQCDPANCSNTAWYTTYSYNLAGDVTSWMHPQGFTITQPVDGARHITQVTSSLSDSRHPATLATGPSGSIKYTAWGAVSQLQDGCVGSGCVSLQETYLYNKRLQTAVVELGTSSNHSADSCRVYNYYATVANASSCSETPSNWPAGTNNNGDVAGYYYNDSMNSTLSHKASFSYDGVNRLASAAATGNSTYSQTYSYTGDGSTGQFGNLGCTASPPEPKCFAPSYSATNNRINSTGYAYGGAGNLTGDGTYTYQWDAESRLAQALNGAQVAISTNTYDAFGERVQDDGDGVYNPVSVDLAYGADGALLLRDTGGDANTHYYVPFQGRILADYYGGTTPGTIFNHPDELGSVATASGYTGNSFQERLYYPFGEFWTGAGSLGMHQEFASLYDYDPEIDQYNTPNRHDNPVGRWMSPDPGNAGADPSDPQTWNAYAYARNNPTTLTDPEGTDVQVCLNNGNGGQDCQWYSDQDYAKYAAAQNSTDQGITAPLANDQNLGHPSGDIMCGSSVCGTVAYGEAPSQDTTDSVVNLGLAAWGLGRAAVSFGAGLVEGAFDRLLGTAGEEATSAIAGGATAYPAEIAGYKVSEHVFERMAQDLGHRVPSQVVEDVIQNGQTLAGKTADVIVKYSPTANINGVTVAIKQSTREIIMIRVGRP